MSIVHAAHCCAAHGCKYGEVDCPVTLKQIDQKFACDICELVQQDVMDDVANVPEGVKLIKSDNVSETWRVPTLISGYVDIVFYYVGGTAIWTGSYDNEVLFWIAAKARLMTMIAQ